MSKRISLAISVLALIGLGALAHWLYNYQVVRGYQRPGIEGKFSERTPSHLVAILVFDKGYWHKARAERVLNEAVKNFGNWDHWTMSAEEASALSGNINWDSFCQIRISLNEGGGDQHVVEGTCERNSLVGMEPFLWRGAMAATLPDQENDLEKIQDCVRRVLDTLSSKKTV